MKRTNIKHKVPGTGSGNRHLTDTMIISISDVHVACIVYGRKIELQIFIK